MMKQLTPNEVAWVNGAAYGHFLLALMPITGITVKGLLLCYELDKNPVSIIPTVAVVALFSTMGAAVGYNLYQNNDAAAVGSLIGGMQGMVISMRLGLDVLK